jgi:hypothetical protein
MTLHYTVEIRNKEGKRYLTKNGNKIIKLAEFTSEEKDENLVHLVCEYEVDKFKSVCKEGSQIDVEVRYYNKFIETYPLLYSYYGDEKRFVKHN